MPSLARPLSRSRTSVRALFAILMLSLAACATSDPTSAPPLRMLSDRDAKALSASGPGLAIETSVAGPWWERAGDPAVGDLMRAILAGHPSLQSVAARIQAARAHAAKESVAMQAGLASGAWIRGDTEGSGIWVAQRALTSGHAFSWELDLFQRLQSTGDASQQRSAADVNDAQGTALALSHDVAAATVNLRSCRSSVQLERQALDSRTRMHHIRSRKAKVGLLRPQDLLLETDRLTSARTELSSRQEECELVVEHLAKLSGLAPDGVRTIMERHARRELGDEAAWGGVDRARGGRTWPAAVLPLPATVLLSHPTVQAASMALDIAWADIESTRVARWPSVRLGAQLSRGVLHATGTGQSFAPGMPGPGLAGDVLAEDVGLSVGSAAERRYRSALSELRRALRRSAQDVEHGLAVLASAQHRAGTASDALAAADEVWRVTLLRQPSGDLSQLEREEVRMRRLAAQLVALVAQRDRSLAWVALMRAAGQPDLLPPQT